jgi:hypothetical protein
MEPMTYSEWCAADGSVTDRNSRWQRYKAYCAGVAFIRTQIGGLSPAVAKSVASPSELYLAAGR